MNGINILNNQNNKKSIFKNKVLLIGGVLVVFLGIVLYFMMAGGDDDDDDDTTGGANTGGANTGGANTGGANTGRWVKYTNQFFLKRDNEFKRFPLLGPAKAYAKTNGYLYINQNTDAENLKKFTVIKTNDELQLTVYNPDSIMNAYRYIEE